MNLIVSLSVNKLSKVTHTSSNLTSAFPAGVRYVAVPAESIPTVVRWSFLSFVATFPFELADLTLMEATLSPAKISGYVFFMSYILCHMPLFSKRSFPAPPGAMWWFFGYVVVYGLNGLFLTEEFVAHFLTVLVTLLQLLLFFWIASDLLKDQKLARSALIIFSLACFALAFGVILQLPGFSAYSYAGRVFAFGDNPNLLGILMALSAVMLIGLSLNSNFSRFTRKILLPLIILPILVMMVNTASRGAMVAFVIGCCVYLLPYWRSKGLLTAVITTFFGVFVMVYFAMTNPDVLERWQQTYYEGKMAQREKIFPTAFEMILERPIIGWQPVQFWHELGFRSGFGWRISDAHNLYLHLLLEVGLIGAIPFFIGLMLCGSAAWRARHGNLGLLPLALLLTVLAGNVSGTGIKMKPVWFVLALTLAAASTATRASGQQSYMLLVRRGFAKTA